MKNTTDPERSAPCPRGSGLTYAHARLLLEQGHPGPVQAAASEGEWACSLALAEEAEARGDWAGAEKLIAPHLAAGRWRSVEVAAGHLETQGRVDEALALLREHPGGYGERNLRVAYAQTAARHGRADEALTALRPYLEDAWMVRTLVEVTEGHGHDVEIAELIESLLVEPATQCGFDRGTTHALALCQVLDRQGRSDEAARVLRARIDAMPGYVLIGEVEEYARLLIRQGRQAELLAFTADGTERGHAEHAIQILAAELARDGRVDEALDLTAALSGTPRASTRFSILSRAGRIDEAVAAARPALEPWDSGNLLFSVLDLLARNGRVAQALALLDELATDTQGDRDAEEKVNSYRSWMLREDGREEEAFALLLADPDVQEGTWYWASLVTHHLDLTGRSAEAIDVLLSVPQSDWGRSSLAERMIKHGRVEEGLALLRAPLPAA
ncbi:hypothetical protein ACIRD3_37050 [Kitasatospora sp. NPDC093550]|uniref:hypothetical protein n=1 Tax=Kitasatospora sp. NPDC093550 TaxID=3364089 RepID=UPI00381A7C60